jgi:hypothetical protein
MSMSNDDAITQQVLRTVEIEDKDLKKLVGNIVMFRYAGASGYDPNIEYVMTFTHPSFSNQTIAFANVFETLDSGDGHAPIWSKNRFTRSGNISTSRNGIIFSFSYSGEEKISIGFDLLIINP